MQRIIYLLRHAEAASTRPGQTDAMRSLTPRGQRQAAEVAAIASSLPLDAIICSTATRARETVAPLLKAGRHSATTTYEAKIYHTCVEGLIEILLGCPAEAKAVLLVGHNPTISELADALAGASNIPESLSPATWVTLTFDGDWSDLAEGRATLATWDGRAASLP